jgi:hypothetical protein
MKKVATLLLILIPVCLVAQKKDSVDVSDLYTPASPGFTLMDKAPTAVDKPTTTKAFEADILNLAQGAAIQITPFWLKNHPQLTDKDLINKKVFFYQTLNLSVATVKTDSNYNIGIGFRAQLIRIYSGKIGNLQDSITALLGDYGAQRMIIQDNTATPDQKKAAIAAITKDTAAVDSIYMIYKQKIGHPTFDIEVAGAATAVTPSSPFSSNSLSKLNRSGAWLNIRYSPYESPLDFVATCRYSSSGIAAKASKRDSSFVDVGLGLFYSGSRFSCSAEYLNRYDNSLQKSYDRLAFAINYKVNSTIVVVGAFGKNFDNVENLFTTLGIGFGLSKNTVKVASPPPAF